MKLRVLLLDETQNWRDDVVKAAGQIFGVYLYHPSSVTRCCELTPSYELIFLASVPKQVPEDESERELLECNIMDGDSHWEPIHYMHVHTVNALPKIKRGALTQGTYPLRHTKGYVWESMEEAEEYWRGSPDY